MPSRYPRRITGTPTWGDSLECPDVKNIVSAVILLVIGLGLLVTGSVSLSGDVKCGNRVMKRGESCVNVGGGGGIRNYDAQKSRNEQTGYIELVLGGRPDPGSPAPVPGDPSRSAADRVCDPDASARPPVRRRHESDPPVVV